jgi:uncharacterized protein (UPF0333 family)
MTELDELFQTKTYAKGSIQNMTIQYNHLINHFNKPIIELSEDEIIDYFNSIDNLPSIKEARLNITILIKRMKNQPIDKLIQYQKQIAKERLEYTKQSLENKKNTLPTYQTLVDYMKELYKTNKYVPFIINYLLLNYALRNQDLDLFISDKPFDDDKNYFIVKKSKIIYIVNNYKTASTYGQKKFEITSKAFINAVNKLPMNSWLLCGKKGEHITSASLGKFIKDRCYDNLTESDYCKIILQDLRGKPNAIDMLKFYSNSRGTDIKKLEFSYNLEINHSVKHMNISVK